MLSAVFQQSTEKLKKKKWYNIIIIITKANKMYDITLKDLPPYINLTVI